MTMDWPTSTRVPNMAHFLTRNAQQMSDEIAIVFEGGTWSWRAFDARVSALAHAMVRDFGIVKGDRVLVQSANNNQMMEIMMAVFRIGAVWTPANFRQSPDEVAFQCSKSGARLMIAEAGFGDHIAACREMIDGVITIGESPAGQSYEALIDTYMGQHVPNAEVSRDDPAWLFFTSGSTGRPKAVVLTQGQLTFTTLNHLNDLMPGTGRGDASLVVAPISHGAGMHQMTQIAAGAKSVILPRGRFDPAVAWELIETWRVSNMFTVPTIVKMLVEHPDVHLRDHASLRYVVYAGAPMYREDQKRALKTLGNVLVQYYGLGEVTGAITVLRPDDHHEADEADARPGTCGVERTGIEITIQNDAGDILGPEQTGEICVVGPAVFAGYFNDPEANRKAFLKGWFRTGDLGHLDAQRYLYITGRASDMYISGGSNVYPREVEEVLLTFPGVDEVAIIGVPDETWGEVGLCTCVAQPGFRLTDADLNGHLEGRVSRYKIPQYYVFLDEMPKTAYGKVTKKLIRDELQARSLLPGAAHGKG
ncbi:acyl-CoA synthetase [Salipiger mangrovisoli]|uniref:AMP-binding protein n=1 Tax=Salipiger mangrovisoli TaxID=2865933 RepID=A0ABR9X5I9_9RHOB|nr:acyl-CoA synthetase [Salipiger mangrovisoli]MBE9638776.1 AMP-binding protein [Salipiger mangrovisoli]